MAHRITAVDGHQFVVQMPSLSISRVVLSESDVFDPQSVLEEVHRHLPVLVCHNVILRPMTPENWQFSCVIGDRLSSDCQPLDWRSGFHNMLTIFTVFRIGNHPLRQARPASFLSVVNPINISVCAIRPYEHHDHRVAAITRQSVSSKRIPD